MKQKMMLSLLFLMTTQTFSQSIGVVGEVFPIAEMSFLTFIEQRLTVLSENGELGATNEQWKKTVENHANRPTPLWLPRANVTRAHYYKPEIKVDFDIRDSEGRVIYPKGTEVNALHQIPSYSPCWLFINADEKAELKWAFKTMHACSNPKIILTGGAIHEAEVFFKNAIYFDQGARITKTLMITGTPVQVSREGDVLKIVQFAIKENGDVI